MAIKKYVAPLVVALLLLAVSATVTSADWTTINVADATVDDAAWGTPTITDACGDVASPGNGRDDIIQAWLRFDGSNFYFRASTCTTSAPPLSDSLHRMGVLFDCNRNNNYNEGDDRRLIVLPDGTMNIFNGLNQPQVTDPFDASYTEFANGTVEWRGEIVWFFPVQCRASLSPVNAKFVVARRTGFYSVQELDSTNAVELFNPMDFGDMYDPVVNSECANPTPGTRLQCNGARHGLLSTGRLGDAATDPDDGTAGGDLTTSLDDVKGSTPDDEDDGVQPSMEAVWAEGSTPRLDYTVSGVTASPDYLSCWVDWDADSVWDAGEQLLNDAQAAAGSDGKGLGSAASLVPVPDVFDGVTPRTLNVRCRLAPQPNQANVPTGPVEFGEVEDYRWAFGATGNRPFNLSSVGIARAGTANDVIVTWSDDAGNEAYRLLGHPTDPYFPAAAGSQIGGIIAVAPWQQTHAAAFGSGTYYYMVLGRVAVEGGVTLESSTSNRVGLFEFGLTPGQPE